MSSFIAELDCDQSISNRAKITFNKLMVIFPLKIDLQMLLTCKTFSLQNLHIKIGEFVEFEKII